MMMITSRWPQPTVLVYWMCIKSGRRTPGRERKGLWSAATKQADRPDEQLVCMCRQALAGDRVVADWHYRWPGPAFRRTVVVRAAQCEAVATLDPCCKIPWPKRPRKQTRKARGHRESPGSCTNYKVKNQTISIAVRMG